MPFLERVLAAGYFPQELPPPFTTVPFASFAAANPNYIPDLWTSYVTKLVRHSLAQVGRNRRILSIPNPINQLRLVTCLDQNFTSIFRAAGSSPISASKPVFRYDSFRAITPQRDFTTIPKKRAEARAVARYILQTDVTRFFPSIYTHAIAWALHTKATAKQNRTCALAGNVLDKAIREAQDGQTMGIPIGPDTSLVIAELILSRVDLHACGSCRGFRWYDDYELSGLTKGECEELLVKLEAALFDFDLDINVGKTEIRELPLPMEDAWVDALRETSFRTGSRNQFKDLTTFFSTAFDLAERYTRKSVLRYAVRKMHGAGIHSANWNHVQRLMAQAAIHEPEVLPHVLGVLNFYQLRNYSIDTALLDELLADVILTFTQRLVGSEVAWAIWGHLQFDRPIAQECATAAQELNDDVVSLLLLDAGARGLLPAGFSLAPLHSVATATAFEDEHWLLAYEAAQKSWFPAAVTATYVGRPHVARLLGSNVYFYDNQWGTDQTARHMYGTPTWLWYQLPDSGVAGDAEDADQGVAL